MYGLSDYPSNLRGMTNAMNIYGLGSEVEILVAEIIARIFRSRLQNILINMVNRSQLDKIYLFMHSTFSDMNSP